MTVTEFSFWLCVLSVGAIAIGVALALWMEKRP